MFIKINILKLSQKVTHTSNVYVRIWAGYELQL